MLYIVATPIGNLEDITFRAVRVLSEVDLILCEDTRVTRKLLDHYSVKTPVESYHAHTSKSKTDRIISRLASGESIALVTDAGTPGISDQGSEFVRLSRQQVPDLVVVSVPGPSAVISALSISGFHTDQFLFLGFLPHKKGRQTLFALIAQSKYTTVFYESPHRLIKTLEALATSLEPDRLVAIARELTKKFEEFRSGPAVDMLEYYKSHPDTVRGECVILVAPKS